MKNVSSIVSNLPISQLDVAWKQYKQEAKLVGKKVRIRYRGPRFDWMKLTTLKKDAVGFSVYFY
jgi:hypothetical protein